MKMTPKIKNRHNTWIAAKKKKDEFLGRQLDGNSFPSRDPFKMALAQDEERRAYLNYELAMAEEYPDHFTSDQTSYMKGEVVRLNKRIKAFQSNQWPSQVRSN